MNGLTVLLYPILAIIFQIEKQCGPARENQQSSTDYSKMKCALAKHQYYCVYRFTMLFAIPIAILFLVKRAQYPIFLLHLHRRTNNRWNFDIIFHKILSLRNLSRLKGALFFIRQIVMVSGSRVNKAQSTSGRHLNRQNAGTNRHQMRSRCYVDLSFQKRSHINV